MPLYKKEKFDDGGMLAIWKITESEEELKIIASLPVSDQKNIEQMQALQRRIESYAVRALLVEIFDEPVHIGYKEGNCPYIKNMCQSISISHSGEFACVYIHKNAKVGIDIESLSRNFNTVSKKILSQNEHKYLVEKHEQVQLALIWSAKEAIYKLMGERNINFSKQMEVAQFIPYNNEGKLNATFVNADGDKHNLELFYQIFDGYVMVWGAM